MGSRSRSNRPLTLAQEDIHIDAYRDISEKFVMIHKKIKINIKHNNHDHTQLSID